MNQIRFNEYRQAIHDDGMQIVDAEYHTACFGSWHIAVNTQPHRRIVWDGKESIWSIQQETKKPFAGMEFWTDLCVIDQAKELPITSVLEILRSGNVG
jgi:hypothetical protein